MQQRDQSVRVRLLDVLLRAVGEQNDMREITFQQRVQRCPVCDILFHQRKRNMRKCALCVIQLVLGLRQIACDRDDRAGGYVVVELLHDAKRILVPAEDQNILRLRAGGGPAAQQTLVPCCLWRAVEQQRVVVRGDCDDLVA